MTADLHPEDSRVGTVDLCGTNQDWRWNCGDNHRNTVYINCSSAKNLGKRHVSLPIATSLHLTATLRFWGGTPLRDPENPVQWSIARVLQWIFPVESSRMEAIASFYTSNWPTIAWDSSTHRSDFMERDFLGVPVAALLQYGHPRGQETLRAVFNL